MRAHPLFGEYTKFVAEENGLEFNEDDEFEFNDPTADLEAWAEWLYDQRASQSSTPLRSTTASPSRSPPKSTQPSASWSMPLKGAYVSVAHPQAPGGEQTGFVFMTEENAFGVVSEDHNWAAYTCTSQVKWEAASRPEGSRLEGIMQESTGARRPEGWLYDRSVESGWELYQEYRPSRHPTYPINAPPRLEVLLKAGDHVECCGTVFDAKAHGRSVASIRPITFLGHIITCKVAAIL